MTWYPYLKVRSAADGTGGFEGLVDFPASLSQSPFRSSPVPVAATQLPEWFGRGPGLADRSEPHTRRQNRAFKIG